MQKNRKQMKCLAVIPLCGILLVMETRGYDIPDSYIRSAGPELSARQAETRFSVDAGNAFRGIAGPRSPESVLSVSQMTGSSPYFSGNAFGNRNNAIISGNRTADLLRDVALSEWTREEAENNQKLFWERYQVEIQQAMIDIQKQIKSCEQEIVDNKHREVLDNEKIAKCDGYLKRIQELIRANRFPADLDGEVMSKNELLDIRTAYETLRKQTLEHMQPHENLIQTANDKVIRFRSEMLKKKIELKTVEIFIRRLDSHEKTPGFGDVLNRLHAGRSLSEIGEEAFPEEIHGESAEHEIRKAPIRNMPGMLDKEKSE